MPMHLPQKQGTPRGRTLRRRQVSRHFRTVSFQVFRFEAHYIAKKRLELQAR